MTSKGKEFNFGFLEEVKEEGNDDEEKLETMQDLLVDKLSAHRFSNV